MQLASVSKLLTRSARARRLPKGRPRKSKKDQYTHWPPIHCLVHITSTHCFSVLLLNPNRSQ